MIGTVVGNYKITDKIGEGGMGAVFKGVDLMLEREVAIKVLRPEFSSQPQIVERFRSEAVTLAKLNHPNVATLHSFFRQGDNFFMVMEFVRGETLDSIIRRSGAMACDNALALFGQGLDGIGHAHSMGIVHRDIKPANMMLTESGSIKVMDFGIARVLGTARMTRQGHIVGTIEYMSPEQVQGLESDARADIYSLAILLYEMLTGRVPFTADTEFALMMAQIQQAPPPPRGFAPHIPLAVEQAIMRALAKKPEARFQTVVDFRAALGIGATAGPVAAVKTVQASPPPTRLEHAAQADELKPTRLAADAVVGQATPDGEIKATRLGAQPQVGYQPAEATSFLARLNWKHYAAAAVLLVALVATPVTLMSLGKKENEPPPAPARSQSPAPAPEPTQSAPVAPPVTQTPAQASPPPAVLPDAANPVQSAELPDAKAAGQADTKATKPRKRDADAAARELARRRAEARRLLKQ
jgi:serine/threonine-protein kinase